VDIFGAFGNFGKVISIPILALVFPIGYYCPWVGQLYSPLTPPIGKIFKKPSKEDTKRG
jgi:hypothetical protein